ncbi:GNAT family N-acetyltransferase [Halobacteriales archaeon QS_4_69_34]|nr:MAG: GNAT family N-acetyltransferase [Halobacteriales archaeon QS_4_69_34]
MRVREATLDELPAVMNVLDGALLDADPEVVRARLRDGADGSPGTVLVAVAEGRVLGALVLDGAGAHDAAAVGIDAIAVRHARRGQGVGTALVEALDEPVAAAFDARVRPFYERLGFAIEPADEPGRYRGVGRDSSTR